MPLIKSKTDKARSKNIATEIKAGTPPEQAKAIAYSVQRKAKGNAEVTTAPDGKGPEVQSVLTKKNADGPKTYKVAGCGKGN